MKKAITILLLTLISLSGCYLQPYRDHDQKDHNEHRQDDNRDEGHHDNDRHDNH